MEKNVVGKSKIVLVSVLVIFAVLAALLPMNAAADEVQTLVTPYDELWKGDITVTAGVPVRWYVNVPEGTEPRGCGATVKIPGLGFGTDTHNKEEGHIVLKEGNNFIYEFTPEMEEDILFTCWMGSGCHKNYIHVKAAEDQGSEGNPSGSSEENGAQKIVTAYSDLWTGVISAKVGDPVRWYVSVPEGTEPRGCGATVKIPDLGFGTDTYNKEEGHIVLKEGENFIYEFTPERTGDILFTCWMGSGCHSNYFHITENGTYSVPAPADPSDITASWNGENAVIGFTAPIAPEGSKIKGYKVIAADDEGNRKKATGDSSPVIIEGLDSSKNYTITVTTLGTSGKSEGGSAVLSAVTQSIPENKPDDDSKADSSPAKEVQIIVTDFADLWTGNITVKQGVPVRWYVNVVNGAEAKGCAATIKIPGLGFGTDTHNKNEGHIVLKEGENFIYEFTPETSGDILFTCWMGSGCHYNYIHVTSDGIADPSAATGGKVNSRPDSRSDSSTAVKNNSANPKTGNTDYSILLIIAIVALIVISRKKAK